MKRDIKELIGFIIFSILNIAIAYSITTPLGIKNVILYKSITATTYEITYEIIIWWVLSFIEALIYEKITQKNSEAF
mgnify:CR=1 FL=1